MAYPLEKKSDISATILRDMGADGATQFSICEFNFVFILEPIFIPCQYLMYNVRRGDV